METHMEREWRCPWWTSGQKLGQALKGFPNVIWELMMIRSMAPRVVAVDEIGTRDDLEALRDVMNCGCRILATVHGTRVEDLAGKPVLSEMAAEKMFERYVVLTGTPRPGTVTDIYDGEFMRLGPAN